jgi:hypothetical protein
MLTKLQVPLIYQSYFFYNRCLPNIERTHLPFYFIFFLHASSAKEEKIIILVLYLNIRLLMIKLWELKKLIVIINLLIVNIVFTNFYSLNEKIYLCMIIVFIVTCKKRDKLIKCV